MEQKTQIDIEEKESQRDAIQVLPEQGRPGNYNQVKNIQVSITKRGSERGDCSR